MTPLLRVYFVGVVVGVLITLTLRRADWSWLTWILGIARDMLREVWCHIWVWLAPEDLAQFLPRSVEPSQPWPRVGRPYRIDAIPERFEPGVFPKPVPPPNIELTTRPGVAPAKRRDRSRDWSDCDPVTGLR